MRGSTTLVLVAAAALAVAGAPAAVNAAVRAPSPLAVKPGSVPPAHDPFYGAPRDIASFRPGQIVASRSVQANLYGLPLPVSAWQISYRTEDTTGHPELAVTTLLVPQVGWSGRGARPVVSVQLPEDSTGTQCAPSYLLDSGAHSPDKSLSAQAVAFVAQVLLAGWAAAVPDFEGPQALFVVGPQAAHAVLDGIRAVKAFDRDGIGTKNPWALSGYSGGANATGWAAELQPSYAPDVTLVGAAMGGTPAILAPIAQSLDGGLFAGFEFGATYSIATAYPQARIVQLLNATGRSWMQTVAGACESDILARFAFKKIANGSTVPDPLDSPSVVSALHLDQMGLLRPATPIYDYHADTDEIVPVAQDNTLVSDWCRQGATVQRVRDLIGEHVEEAVLRTASVLEFLAQRFAGRTPVDTCS